MKSAPLPTHSPPLPLHCHIRVRWRRTKFPIHVRDPHATDGLFGPTVDRFAVQSWQPKCPTKPWNRTCASWSVVAANFGSRSVRRSKHRREHWSVALVPTGDVLSVERKPNCRWPARWVWFRSRRVGRRCDAVSSSEKHAEVVRAERTKPLWRSSWTRRVWIWSERWKLGRKCFLPPIRACGVRTMVKKPMAMRKKKNR